MLEPVKEVFVAIAPRSVVGDLVMDTSFGTFEGLYKVAWLSRGVLPGVIETRLVGEGRCTIPSPDLGLSDDSSCCKKQNALL